MKKTLTRKQKESYQCLLDYTKEHGYPPTVREFGKLIGVKSTSSAFSRIKQLELNGYIRRIPASPRAIEILEGGVGMNKVYVDVVAEFRKDGQLVPIFFTWEDGRKYSIDRILKIERCASRKAGGVGMMYTCMIQGQESHLFYEVDKWFMERKTA